MVPNYSSALLLYGVLLKEDDGRLNRADRGGGRTDRRRGKERERAVRVVVTVSHTHSLTPDGERRLPHETSTFCRDFLPTQSCPGKKFCRAEIVAK